MTRQWEKFSDDEIAGIWGSYMRTEFGCLNPLRQSQEHTREVRLTPLEIIRLVEHLMNRISIKLEKDWP